MIKKQHTDNFFKLVSIIIGIFVVVWILYPSKYDQLMSEALKKQKEHSDLKIFDGEVEPALPNKKDNDKTVLGIDTNKNGIRDDVDIFINRTAKNYNERMAMRQYARTQQILLKACKENYKGGISIMESNSANAQTCLEFISESKLQEGRMPKQEEVKILYGNFQSNECYDYFAKNSTIVEFSNSSNLHLNCEFKIEDIKEVISSYKNMIVKSNKGNSNETNVFNILFKFFNN